MMMRKLHNGDITRYYDDKIKANERAWACSTHGRLRNAYGILVRQLERK